MAYRRRLKYYLIKLCRLQDSPRAIAGGFACGTVIHFYPTCGFGALFAVGVARLFRTNLIAATLAWAITLPLFPLLFYLNLVTGTFVHNLTMNRMNLNAAKITHIHIKSILLVGKVFLLGSVINGLLGAVIIWFSGYLILQRHRKEVICFISRVL